MRIFVTIAGAIMLGVSCYALELAASLHLRQVELAVSLDRAAARNLERCIEMGKAEHARLEAHIKWFIKARSGMTALERLEAAMEEYDVANQ